LAFVGMKPENVPSLSESAFLRYLNFSALYVAQGIPHGLLLIAIPAWLAANGKSPTEIGGYVAIVGLPWSFKVINAPLMDRFTYLPMGRKRPWVIMGQLGLILSFFSMSLITDPLNSLSSLMTLGFMVSFCAVTQDIAVDGMAIDLLPVDQQARANGLMWGSKTLGISASVAAGSWIVNAYGYFYAVVSFSMIVSVIILIPLFLRERPGEKLLPWTEGQPSSSAEKAQLHSWKVMIMSLIRVFFLPVSLFMGLAVFSHTTGKGLIDTLLPVFTVQELGWTDTQYSQIFATATLISGVGGMFLGGFLVDYFGKKKMIFVYMLTLISIVGALSSFNAFWVNKIYMTGFIVGIYTFFTFTSIAVFASAMRLCWKRVAATQFTIYMAIANLGLSSGAFILGFLKEMLPWNHVLLAYLVFPMGMLVFLPFINFEKHEKRLEELERQFNVNNGKSRLS